VNGGVRGWIESGVDMLYRCRLDEALHSKPFRNPRDRYEYRVHHPHDVREMR
jgi:hypothetical protein